MSMIKAARTKQRSTRVTDLARAIGYVRRAAVPDRDASVGARDDASVVDEVFGTLVSGTKSIG